MMRRVLAPFLALLSLGTPSAAQDPATPVTATFLLAPGEWTQEFERLTAHLTDEVRHRGHEVIGVEAHAPNVVAITFQSGDGRTPGVRHLLPILRDPRIGAWPGLELLGVQGDAGPLTLELEGEVAFEVTRPEGTGWDDEMIARKVFEKAYETRTGFEPTRDVLEAFQFATVRTTPIQGERVRVNGTFLYRHPRFTAVQLDRILSLFLPRPTIELRRVLTPAGAVEAALYALDPRRALGEVNGQAVFVDAVAQVVARFEAAASGQRLPSRLTVVHAGPAPFATEDFARLSPALDSRGRPALDWELEPAAAERFERFTAENTGARLAYCVAGELWTEFVLGSRLPGRGAIYGDFSRGKVDKVARLFAPIDPPSTWTLTSVRTAR